VKITGKRFTGSIMTLYEYIFQENRKCAPRHPNVITVIEKSYFLQI
jgi:hypothetical protein